MTNYNFAEVIRRLRIKQGILVLKVSETLNGKQCYRLDGSPCINRWAIFTAQDITETYNRGEFYGY